MTVSTSRRAPSRPAKFMRALAVEFATCSYARYRPEMGLLVRTTAGAPRQLHYPLAGNLPRLAPDAAWIKMNDRAAFTELYWHKLDNLGSFPLFPLAEMAEEIANAHREDLNEPRRLVLACFCNLDKAGAWCHREILATWLNSFGIDCPELTKETDR